MNRTLTVEVRDIPEEVWEYFINDKGSEEAVDELIREVITAKATTALILVYQMGQAVKAGIQLETMVPTIVNKLFDDTAEHAFGDDLSLELEKKTHDIIKKFEETKKHAAD